MKNLLIVVVLLCASLSAVQWHLLAPAGTDKIKEIQFTDSLHGWAVSEHRLLRTPDHGVTWVVADTSPSAEDYFCGLAVLDTGHIYLSRGRIWSPHAVEYWVWVDEWHDGGRSTVFFNHGYDAALQACRFSVLDSEHVWHLGWERSYPPPANAAVRRTGSGQWVSFRPLAWSSYDASFVDTMTGWAAWNVVAKTTNSGDSWVTLTVDIGARRIQMLDTLCGWLVTTSGLMGTTDGGVSWTTAVAETGLKALRFCNARHGVVVGSGGHVLHTTDGGAAWVRDTVETTQGLTAVCMVDSVRAWIGGVGGVVLGMGDWAVSGVEEQRQPLRRPPELVGVWPNPAIGTTLRLRYVGDAGSVSVYDACGRPVRTAATRGDCIVQFDLHGLAEGTYFARAVGSGGGATGPNLQFVLLR